MRSKAFSRTIPMRYEIGKDGGGNWKLEIRNLEAKELSRKVCNLVVHSTTTRINTRVHKHAGNEILVKSEIIFL